MRLVEINSGISRPIGGEPKDAPQASEASRALVALAPPARTHRDTSHNRPAPFLAHLIATKDQAPQTRDRRRAEPAEVIAAYRNAAALDQ